VDRQAARDEVEAAVGEGHRSHVACDQLHAIGYALGPGVRERRGGIVARLVGGLPKIEPDDVPARQELGHHEEHCAATAPHVQRALVAAQPERREDPGPHDQLSAKRAVQV